MVSVGAVEVERDGSGGVGHDLPVEIGRFLPPDDHDRGHAERELRPVDPQSMDHELHVSHDSSMVPRS